MSSRIEPSILSRPTYGTLNPVSSASGQLMIADAEGGEALLDLVKQAPQGFLDNAEICYVPGAADHTKALEALGAARFYTGSSVAAIQSRLMRNFERLHMGTQIYMAGSESLMGVSMKTAMDAGIDFEAIQTEHRGTLARRMQCVHCKGITEDVTTQPAECAHCGLLLLVRDHYSRRYAAFQGVNINAEDPTDIPEKEEVFK